MNNLEIYPYVRTEQGWSMSDSVMATLWMQLEQEGKVEQLFYDGSIRDISGWLDFVKNPGVFLAVLADPSKGRPVHIAWLKDVADGVAWAHHCALGNYHRGVWPKILGYWRQFPLRLLLGLTPATNLKAVKYVQKICKFIIVGEIPEICNMAYEGRRVPGIVSYLQLHQEGE